MLDLKLKSGNRVKYIDSRDVESNLINRGFIDDVALRDTPRSDLTTHVYEGGFKVWECSIDLCEFMDGFPEDEFVGKRVLELGCGAALPAVLAVQKGASYVIAQDFNESVTACFSKDNFEVNGISSEKYSLLSGPWQELRGKVDPKSFDLVLTSETIYNEDDYVQLHDAFDLTLTEKGKIWLAAKFFYFGVGGNVPGFLEFVRKSGKFKSEEKISTHDGVPRQIIELTRV